MHFDLRGGILNVVEIALGKFHGGRRGVFWTAGWIPPYNLDQVLGRAHRGCWDNHLIRTGACDRLCWRFVVLAACFEANRKATRLLLTLWATITCEVGSPPESPPCFIAAKESWPVFVKKRPAIRCGSRWRRFWQSRIRHCRETVEVESPEIDDRSERHPLDAWVLNTLPRAVRFAQSLLSNSSDADDIVHDCYCRLLQKSSHYDLARDGTKLLYRSITNACIDQTRKGQRTVSIHRGDDEDHTDHMMVDHKSETPAAIVEQRELVDAIGFALARIPVEQRAALELKSMGYSLSEIADAVGVSESNAGVLVHRARRAVADYLKRTYGEESA